MFESGSIVVILVYFRIAKFLSNVVMTNVCFFMGKFCGFKVGKTVE